MLTEYRLAKTLHDTGWYLTNGIVRSKGRSSMDTIYTIGHSNLHSDRFLDLLKKYNITMVVDIRSVPFSRFYPQFNKENLAKSLDMAGINYIFEGDRLGGRIKDKECFISRQIPKRKNNIAELVDFEVLKKRDWFNQGINNIIERSKSNCVSILCSEEQPLRCHRNLLVARYLFDLGYKVLHIRGSGEIEGPSFKPQQEQISIF